MSLVLLNRFEERESKPKQRYAIFKGEDGRQWRVTLTIHLNREALQISRPCVENTIYAMKKASYRKNALTKLFFQVVDFSKTPLFDDTITRVLLRTSVANEAPELYGRRVPEALHYPLHPYMGISLNELECFIEKDANAAIPFVPLEVYRQHYPLLQFVPFSDVRGMHKKGNKLHTGVYKVSVGQDVFIYKKPNSPDDVPSQSNEIESLMLLSKSSRVIGLHGLVFSANPYLTHQETQPAPVVRGILISYAPQGNLSNLLAKHDVDISWSQRLLWAMQIAAGLQDIHDANFAHLDLKSHNVVIGEHNDSYIIDLGGGGITYGWTAPEVWFEEDYEDLPLELLQTADIYSLGVVLWEIGTRKNVNIPIGMEHEDFFVTSGGEMPKQYEDLLQACLHKDPARRPKLVTAITILQTLLKGAD